jgi:pimeloyl-ACP methyl ester carboxylesterase
MTEYVEANGLRIGYDVHGAGPPLVLLHGAGSSGREDWAAQVPLFSRAFRLYVPDARGHATTRHDVADGFSYQLLVEDLAAFVDALHLDTFHLMGFSMGGMTALAFATRWPERLRTLIVAGIAVEREPRTSVVRRLMDPDRRPPDGPLSTAALARRHDPVQGEGAWRALLRAIASDVETQPVLTPAELRRIDLPTLVAVGDRDPFVPVGNAWALMRQLPDARLLVVPDSGHELMVRRPGLFNEAVSSFYRSTEQVARRRAMATEGGAA